ncbi:MAG: acyl dehydratase [Pseudomonadales bacterium]
MTTSNTLAYNEVAVGDKLPIENIEITAGLIAGGAIASRDFTPVHHNKAAAQEQGMQDIFMNILTSNGLIGAYVSRWAGPDSTTKAVDVKLGAPNHPGFKMAMSGEVKSKDDGCVEVEVLGKNHWGMHLQATVRVALPGEH